MKRFTTILMVVVLMVCLTMAFLTNVNANENVNTNDQFVHHKSCSETLDLLAEWVKSAGDGRERDELVNGYYRGYGVIDGVYFEESYGCSLTPESIEEALTRGCELSEFRLGVAGYYDDYIVYKMYARSETESIGREYDYETEEYVEYYEGDMYFMVCYDD